MITVLTSFRKGGTGKSTLASLISMAPRKTQRPICLVDCDGGSSQIFGLSDYPGLSEVLEGARLRDVVVEIEVEERWPGKGRSILGGGVQPRLWILPRGRGEVRPDEVLEVAEALNSISDVVIDLPAYPRGEYDYLVRRSDVVLLVANPDDASLRAVLDYSLDGIEGVVKPVLNKSVKELSEPYIDALRKFGVVHEVPFDEALVLLFEEPEKALRKMKKQTARSIEEVAQAAFKRAV